MAPAFWLPVSDVLAGWNDGTSITGSNCLVAFSGVIFAVGGDTANCQFKQDLVEQPGQYGRISNVPACNLDGANSRRIFVEPCVFLASDTVLWASMFTDIPLAFAPGLVPCAVGQQIGLADATSIRKAHIHRLLAATWCDAIRRGPIQPNSWKILCTWR